MSEVYLVACGTCQSLERIETTETEWIDGKPVAWEHRCAKCGTACGFAMNGGTLNLGVVKATPASEGNDFEIFTEEPWQT